MKTKFYEFRQNNSGGSFDVDDNVCKWMFVEASNSEQANDIAQTLGVYFNGCQDGMDCDCCGDRWNEADEQDAIDLKEYGKSYSTTFATIEDLSEMLVNEYCWGKDEFARVFYLNGDRKQIRKKETA